MRTRTASLLLAALVVLAGCAASAGQTASTAGVGTTTARTEPTDETATTTTATTTADLPPGVNATGLEDPAALVAAHRSALADTGFAFRFRANVSVGPASQWTVQRGTVEAGLSPLVVHSASVRELDGDLERTVTDLWADERTVVVRYRRANRTELRQFDRSGGNASLYDDTWAHLPRADLDSQATLSWVLELALAVGEYDLVRTATRDGHRIAILRATDPAAASDFTDLNATLVVDTEGRVRSLSLTATVEDEDAIRVRYAFELTEVGNASVEVGRPRWVVAAIPPNETAGNATTHARNATTTAD